MKVKAIFPYENDKKKDNHEMIIYPVELHNSYYSNLYQYTIQHV